MIPEMTSYERVMAAVKKQPLDMYPVINPTSVATLDGMKYSHAYFPEAHTNVKKMVDLAAAGHELFGFDSVAPYFSILLETSALGAKVNWGDSKRIPYVVDYPLKKMEDIHIPHDYLDYKEFQSIITACDMLNKRYHGEVAVIGKVIGPWTLAYQLYGVEKLILDTILYPQKTKDFINALSEIPITFAKKQFEAGAHLVTWAEHCTSDLVSPSIYEEFVAPIHRQAALKLAESGPVILHTCGNLMDRLDVIANTGISMLHLDSRNDIAKAQEQLEGRMVLTGSINIPFTLTQGTPAMIREEVDANLVSGIRLISPECNMPYNVPKKNIFTLVKAVHGFKKYYS